MSSSFLDTRFFAELHDYIDRRIAEVLAKRAEPSKPDTTPGFTQSLNSQTANYWSPDGLLAMAVQWYNAKHPVDPDPEWVRLTNMYLTHVTAKSLGLSSWAPAAACCPTSQSP